MALVSRLERRRTAAAAAGALLCLAALAPAGAAAPGPGRDGAGDVRVTAACGAGATSELRLRADDGAIRLELEVEHARVRGDWRVALVHERRVAWKGQSRTAGRSGAFRVRRSLPDLPGADTVTARVWGPAGLTCVTTATLAGR